MTPQTIRGRRGSLASFFGAVVLIGLLIAPNARAQRDPVNELASDIAHKLEKAKAKKVAVFDFVGPDRNLTALGVKLADDFSLALQGYGRHLHVEDRAKLAQSVKAEDYGVPELLDPSSMLALASYFDFDTAVLGSVWHDKGQLKLSVTVTRVGKKGSEAVAKKDATIPSSEDVTNLAGTIVARETAANADNTIPPGGTHGYSYPTCLYCPMAQYSQAAIGHRIQGTVMVVAIVNADGHASDVKVLKHLPGGLSDKAIEAVEQWRFKPAADHDGNPVAVRQIIEVTFHLY